MKKIIISLFISLVALTACEIKFDDGSATITGDGSNAVTAFYFSKDDNLQFGLDKDVVGRFNGRQIFLTLPFGVVPSTLVPTINISEGICSMQSGKEYDFSKEIQPVEFSVSRDDGSIELYVVYVEEVSKTAKKITSFRFKETEAEIKIIGSNIDALVSGGTNLLLTPIIEHEGDTISPGSGETIDFSDSYNEPVEYTVKAYDGSTSKYYVTVSDRTASSKEITSFAIVGIPEAQVTISGLEIEVGVPEGSEFMLTPIIEITGESIDPASGTAQIFSDDVLYTVFAEDGSSQTYTVKVKEIPSSNKEITGFEFRVEDNPSLCNSTSECNDVKANIAGVNISAKVPYGTNIKSLIPRIEYPDSQGAQIMPASGIAQNFENSHEDPFLYTVIAADESFSEYLVTVEIDEESKPSSEKEITKLSLEVDGKTYNAKIIPNNFFITVYVPESTDLANFTANIDFTEGATMVPSADEVKDFSKARMFTITAADDSVRYYSVVAKEIGVKTFTFEKSRNRNEGLDRDYFAVVNGDAIEFTVPYDEKIDNLKPTIEFYGDSVNPNVDSARDFTSPVTYKINSENNTVGTGDDFDRNYEVNVYREQAITYFAFTKDENEGKNLQTDVIGKIGPKVDDSGRIIINLRVPYDTIVENLVPEIQFSGKAIDPLSGVAQDFSKPVEYNLLAGRSRTILTKSYSVVVTKELNYAKDIKSFYFRKDENSNLNIEKDIPASILSAEIKITVPYGSDLTALTPDISVSHGATLSPASGEVVDFSKPVYYTVTAEDGSKRKYHVTVDIALNHSKEILEFTFLKDLNPQYSQYLSENIVLTQEDINEETSEIIVEVPIPFGTSPMMLVPEIKISGASISPESGSKQDFSQDGGVTYTVTAENGTKRDYVVKTVSTSCKITSFVFTIDNNINNNWTEDAVGEIIGNQINVPVSVITDLSSLVATISHTGIKIEIVDNPEPQYTGETPIDYRSPVFYRVTSEKGNYEYYIVNIVDPRSWGTPQNIDVNAVGAGGTEVAMDQSGNAIAVWGQFDGTRYNIWSNRYVNGSWGIAESIENEDASAYNSQVVMNQSGNAIAVWRQYDANGSSIWSNRYVNGSWGVAQRIDNNNADASSPQVAMDHSGNAIAVWNERDGNMYSICSNRYVNGLWRTAQKINNGNTNSYGQQIAMDQLGNAIAVWNQKDGVIYNIWSNRYVNGSWRTAQQIDNDNEETAIFPKVAMDQSGNGIVVWKQWNGTDNNIWSNRYVNGLWRTAQKICNGNTNSYGQQIAMDQSGNAIVVWNQYGGTRYNIWSNRYVNGTWRAAQQIDIDNPKGGEYPQVVMDQSGNAIVIWIQYNASERESLWSNRYVNGSWKPSELILNDISARGLSRHVAMDQSGSAIVVWGQSKVYVRHLK